MNPLKIAGVLCCLICLLLAIVLRSNIGILLSLAGLVWVAQWKQAEDKKPAAAAKRFKHSQPSSPPSLGMDVDGATLLQRLNRLEQEVGELKQRLVEMEYADRQTDRSCADGTGAPPFRQPDPYASVAGSRNVTRTAAPRTRTSVAKIRDCGCVG